MKHYDLEDIKSSLNKFINWLEDYGETSFDHQSFFASTLGGKAKALYYNKPLLGTIAVAPLIFCEAFVPSARRLFWHKQRFPIADAHYAMGFAFLYQIFNNIKFYEKAVNLLKTLEQTRSPGYQYFCWGYPFDWVTRNGTLIKNTPMITSTPYVFEAFKGVYNIDKNKKWLDAMRSIAEHAINDIKDFETSVNASTCSYTPFDKGGVINASAYRAFLLTSASVQFADDRYWKIAERNINFVLESQQPNGSWFYAMDDTRDFVDHFHTCFVLKALAKIEKLTGNKGSIRAIEKGISYYVKNLIDDRSLPQPFSRAPRLTVYKKELYDYAECINLCVLLKDKFEELNHILAAVIDDVLNRWQKPDGSFRSRHLYIGWDNVPMHRWAQSQLFRSLCFLLFEEDKKSKALAEKSEIRNPKSEI